MNARNSCDFFDVLSNCFANLMKFCNEELSIEMILSALRSDSISIRFTCSCITGHFFSEMDSVNGFMLNHRDILFQLGHVFSDMG